MLNDRRRLWYTLLFLGMLAPFVALLLISLFNHVPKPQTGALVPGAAAPQTMSADDSGLPGGFGGLTGGSPVRANVPLLAGGDGHEIWVVHPQIDNSTPGFQLFNRPANTTTWRLATQKSATTFWNSLGLPQALLVERPAPEERSGSPLIVGDSGFVDEFSLEGRSAHGQLPPEQSVKASTGAVDQAFVLTFGVPLASTTRAFDPLPDSYPTPLKSESNGSATATAATAATSAASMPATTLAMNSTTSPAATQVQAETAASGPQRLFNVYWFPPSHPGETSNASATATTPATTTMLDAAAVSAANSSKILPRQGVWCYLPPLGDPMDHARVPAENAMIAMAEHDGLLVIFWVDPARKELVSRTLKYADPEAAWSEPVRSPLPQEINGSRLLPVTLDKSFYLFWPVPTGDSVELRGGWIDLRPGADAYQLAAKNMVPPLLLGAAAQGISVTDDVAIAPAEDSIFVAVITHDLARPLVSLLFDRRGTLLSGAKPIELTPPRRDIQIGQNITMVLMALMLTLSLWQWRQKPAPVALPKSLVIAPLHLRGGALLVDVAIPYAITSAIFAGFANGPFAMFYSWVAALGHPEDFFKAMDFFFFAGFYFVHACVGELFFQRSIGKALMGLRVAALDGQKPSLGAILLRNIIRLPEMALGLGPVYVLISDRRQRLGDLVARTLVVTTEDSEKDAAGADKGRKDN